MSDIETIKADLLALLDQKEVSAEDWMRMYTRVTESLQSFHEILSSSEAVARAKQYKTWREDVPEGPKRAKYDRLTAYADRVIGLE